MTTEVHQRQRGRGSRWQDYVPLIVIVALTLLSAGAKQFRPYAYIYPFIELALGLGFLSHWQPMLIYSATVIVLVFGSIGVLRALFKGLDIECACMGTVLHVPLSTIALIEDLGMALMAGVMLWSTMLSSVSRPCHVNA